MNSGWATSINRTAGRPFSVGAAIVAVFRSKTCVRVTNRRVYKFRVMQFTLYTLTNILSDVNSAKIVGVLQNYVVHVLYAMYDDVHGGGKTAAWAPVEPANCTQCWSQNHCSDPKAYRGFTAPVVFVVVVVLMPQAKPISYEAHALLIRTIACAHECLVVIRIIRQRAERTHNNAFALSDRPTSRRNND